MARLPLLTICVLISNVFSTNAASYQTTDGGSDLDMHEVRLILEKYGNQIESLQRENMRLEQKMATLEEKVMLCEQNVSHTSRGENSMPGQDAVLDLTDEEPRSCSRFTDDSVKNNNRRVESTTAVAFHAVLAHAVSNPAPEHIIPFEKSITNIGAHLNPNTGVFTCPEVGVYHFSWMIATLGAQYFTTELVRNNVVIGSAMSGDSVYWTTGAASAITMLVPGDTVWVRIAKEHSTGADLRQTFTMFNGFLIK